MCVCVCVCVCVIVGQFRNVLFKATAANESRQELVNSFNPSDRRVSFRLVPRLASRKLDCLQVVLFGLDFLRCVRVHAWLVACEQSYPALGERQIPALPANLRHIMKEEHACNPRYLHTLISANGFALSQSRVARTFSSKSALADADMCATAAVARTHRHRRRHRHRHRRRRRHRHSHRHRHRQTERQTDRRTDRRTDGRTSRRTDRQTHSDMWLNICTRVSVPRFVCSIKINNLLVAVDVGANGHNFRVRSSG